MVAAAAMIGALAAMALPAGLAYTPEIAAILAVGAIALMAGHAWGLLIVALADVVLVGKIWPVVLLQADATTGGVAAAIALAGALPGLAIVSRTLPGTVEVVMGTSDPRRRSLGMTLGVALMAAALLVPAL